MALFQVRARPADPARESRALQFLELPLIGANIQAQQGVASGDVDSALRDAAVWKCTDLIASMISVMDPDGYKGPEIGVGAANRVANPPQILDRPAAASDIMDWMYQVQICNLLGGNAFGEIVGRGPFGRPTQIELQHPNKVKVRENSKGEVEIRFGSKEMDPRDVWQASSYRMPGMHVGMSPIAYQDQTIRVKRAAHQFGGGWFDGGGHPTGIITNDTQKLVGPDEADTIKKRFMTAVKGKAREPVVMGGGWKYDQIQINPEESQFLATMKYAGGQICGIYRVPPELVGEASEGSSITYANVESRGLDFLTFTMMRWVRRWERWLDDLTPPGQYVKLDLDVLLRTDALTRWRIHHMGVGMEAIAPSEVRTAEDRPPLTPEQAAEIAALRPIPPVIDTPQAGS